MHIIVGSAAISLAVLFFCIVLLAARNPRKPAWASAAWVGNCHSIVILLLGVGGIFSLGSGLVKFTQNGVDLLSIVIALVILAATVLVIKSMKVRKKVAEFEAMQRVN